MPVDRCLIPLIPLLLMAAGAGAPRPTQPEDRLLDPGKFRGDLLRRGMTELLEAHIEECPPQSGADKLIHERHKRLAVYLDQARDEDERLAALDKAISLLDQAVREYPDAPRAMDRRLELGKDLIYKRAEPYYNSILFGGGSKADRQRLLAVATRATKVFDELIRTIDKWNQGLGRLGEKSLDELQSSGQIERYRMMELNARYFACWARFYRALAARPGSARDDAVKSIITYLTVDKKDWIEIDHAESGVQCQALLLLGMTYRLAGDAEKAVEFLTRAVKRTSELTDPAEKTNLQWVIWLGKIEQIKVQRDGGRFGDALAGIKAMTAGLADDPTTMSIRLAAALLEGSIYSEQASAARSRNDLDAYATLTAHARQPLISLATRYPRAKGRIYSSIYPLLGDDPDPATLSPFDKGVYVAGLLKDAARMQERIEQIRDGAGGKPDKQQARRMDELSDKRALLLQRAIKAAEMLVADESQQAERLRPEAMMNLATSYHQLGRSLAAARTFYRLVDKYPEFDRARDAALYAVRIAAELNTDSAGYGSSKSRSRSRSKNHPAVRKLFVEALRCLIDRYGDTKEARYWSFFLANTLELEGNYARAAREYAKVDPDHENYLDARLYRVNCLVRLFEQATSSQPADQDGLRRGARALVDESLACAEAMIGGLGRIRDKQRRTDIEKAIAGCLLTAAGTSNDPPLKDHRATLKILEGFENRYGAYRGLVGRAMRLEIVALQALGRIDKARALIPEYVKRDPENAGTTLRSLLAAMRREVDRARKLDRDAEARAAAGQAAILAEWLYKWARTQPDRVKPAELFAIHIQLGQAYLEAGSYDEARALFEQCAKQGAARSSDSETKHGPTLLGLAESHYRIGLRAVAAEERDLARTELRDAGKRFMAIWRRTEPHSELWWRASLRGLEVPLTLNELDVAKLETASRNRSLTDEEQERLAAIPGTLRRIEQTVLAEQMSDQALGGHKPSFTDMLGRVARLSERVARLTP